MSLNNITKAHYILRYNCSFSFSYLAFLNLFLCLLFSALHHYYKTEMAFFRTLIYDTWTAHKSVSRNVDDRTFFFLTCVLSASPHVTSDSNPYLAEVYCKVFRRSCVRHADTPRPDLLNGYVPRDSAQVKFCASRN